MRIRRTDQKGFTLVELLVVVVIMGILAAIAIPSINNQRRAAALNETRTSLETAVSVMNSYLATNYGEMPNIQIACHRQDFYTKTEYTSDYKTHLLTTGDSSADFASIASTVGMAANFTACAFPCNDSSHSCDAGGTTTAWYSGSSGAVQNVKYAPLEDFDKSVDVELVYEPCYFSHASSSLTPCASDATEYGEATTHNFVVYAYNDKIDPSNDFSARGGTFYMYKSMTGKYYRGYNQDMLNAKDPSWNGKSAYSGCEVDSGTGEVLCEIA